MSISDSIFVQRFIEHKTGNIFLLSTRIIVLLGKMFKDRRIPVLAQSLAYTTIFTLVPILAAFFAVLGQITQNKIVQENIKDFISVYLFPEYVASIFTQLERLSAASAVFGAIGFPTLFLAGVFLYVKVYSSINEIWLSEKKSKWFKNSLSFIMTLFLGPMILVLVFSIPPYVQTLPYYKEVISVVYIDTLFTQLIPFGIIFAGLFVLYLYIPVTTVKVSAALRGALVAALVIQIGNHLVSVYLKLFSKLDVFYGSLAMIPIFLLWVFMIWTVVLSGAALAFIFHYHRNTAYLDTKGMYNDESLLCSALQVMMYIVQAFQKKDGALNFEQIQLMLGMNRKRLSYILSVLTRERLVIAYDEGESKRRNITRYQLGMAPEMIKICSLIPLFYDPQEHIIFEEDLTLLLRFLEIHPCFFQDDTSLKDILLNPKDMLKTVRQLIPESTLPD